MPLLGPGRGQAPRAERERAAFLSQEPCPCPPPGGILTEKKKKPKRSTPPENFPPSPLFPLKLPSPSPSCPSPAGTLRLAPSALLDSASSIALSSTPLGPAGRQDNEGAFPSEGKGVLHLGASALGKRRPKEKGKALRRFRLRGKGREALSFSLMGKRNGKRREKVPACGIFAPFPTFHVVLKLPVSQALCPFH